MTKKKLRNGFYSVFYIINCLSSFWAHFAKTNNDIILFLNDPLGSKPFNNTSVVGECNVILVDCGSYFGSMQTYITCTGNFLSYRQNKCIFLSEKQAPFVFQANEDWCEFHFFKPSSLTLFSLLELFTYSSTLNYNSPLTDSLWFKPSLDIWVAKAHIINQV